MPDMTGKSIFAALLGLIVAAASQARSENAAPAFEEIKKLVGDWKGTYEWTGARSGGGSLDVAYSLTGNGSALVEDLVQEGVRTMTSLYHLDGPDLRLTHYCGAQNQPRLKADRVDVARGEIDFAFVDATNLRSPDAPHVYGLELRLLDPSHLRLTFLFRSGDAKSRERIELTRTDKNPATNS